MVIKMVPMRAFLNKRLTILGLGLALMVFNVPKAHAIGPASFVTMHDTIPNFAVNDTIRSVQNGSWSSPSTWSPARVPLPTDIVGISHTVTYDSMTGDVDAIGIASGGVLRFSAAQSTRLNVANLQVQPQGTLEIGTAANPIPANLTAEIIIKN